MLIEHVAIPLPGTSSGRSGVMLAVWCCAALALPFFNRDRCEPLRNTLSYLRLGTSYALTSTAGDRAGFPL